MSEPTYLIRLEHDPQQEMLPYTATITRLSDDGHVATRWGTSAEEAVKAAQLAIRRESERRDPPREFFVQEDGTLIVGESVRVLRQP